MIRGDTLIAHRTFARHLPRMRHVGCCDQSPGKHATKHFHATRHPIIEGYDPPEGWGWCYVDEVYIDLGEDYDAADGTDSPYA